MARFPQVGRQEVPGADKTKFVFAYHEIVETPPTSGKADANRCEIYYRGSLSPDFYAWIFPHGDTMSVGTGSAQQGLLAEGLGRGSARTDAASPRPRRSARKARRSR